MDINRLDWAVLVAVIVYLFWFRPAEAYEVTECYEYEGDLYCTTYNSDSGYGNDTVCYQDGDTYTCY